MPLIYRIEDQSGIGCYADYTAAGYVNMLDWSRHPEPNDDAGLSKFWKGLKNKSKHWDWYFGYKDLDQLRSWMYTKDIREILDNRGFMISIYRVEDHEFSAGDTQAVFIKKNAVLQGKLKLTEI